MIELSKIRIDVKTQPRAELNQDTIAEYADAYKSGAKFPPVKLFFDGASYWLADGFHRYNAARDAGLTTIYEEVIPGTLRDAILYSLSANSKHGLKRSNADKRKAVQTLLDDPEWSKWSSNEIAKRCAVGDHLVAELRKSSLRENEVTGHHSANAESESVTYTTKHGTTTTMDTANIGRKKADEWREPAPEAKQEMAEESHPEEAPPEYTALDQAMDTVRDLQDALALANAGDLSEEDKTQAADLIARLREEVRILTLKLRAVTASRDQYQTENGELKRQILRQRREIDKITGTKTA